MDPRVGEIESRLNAATTGPWDFAGSEIDTIPDPDGDTPWKSVMECRVDCMSYCYGGSVAMDIGTADREFIAHSPSDVAYLLAELRKRDEALAAVAEAQARAYDKGYTHGRHDGELSHFSRVQRPPKSRKNPYRAAVTGGGA